MYDELIAAVETIKDSSLLEDAERSLALYEEELKKVGMA